MQVRHPDPNRPYANKPRHAGVKLASPRLDPRALPYRSYDDLRRWRGYGKDVATSTAKCLGLQACIAAGEHTWVATTQPRMGWERTSALENRYLIFCERCGTGGRQEGNRYRDW